MSLVSTLRDVLDDGSSGPQTYECQECGNVFETDAAAGQAACMQCPTTNVEPVQA